MRTAKYLIHAMLTENTGKALCDSGDAYGRNWQRNSGKTLADFEAEPSATLEVSKYTDRDGKTYWEANPTVSLFHHLADCCGLDEICEEFNAMPVDDWSSDYYGVSAEGQEWINSIFRTKGEAQNTYNWCANFSQVIQYQILEHLDSGDLYALIQIHGGCDVRGGYTDAKLFRLDCEEWGLAHENCGFYAEDSNGFPLHLDWMGEWITAEGSCPTDDELEAFCVAIGEGVHAGDAFECC